MRCSSGASKTGRGVATMVMLAAWLGATSATTPTAAQQPAAGVQPDPLPATTAQAAEQPMPRPAPPEVLRGSVAAAPVVEPAAGPDGSQLVGGERVWFVDRDNRRLTGCRLVNTVQVGGQAIWCTERRLPRGAVARD